ncbi:Aryl hydrocarbon receptor [Trichoplax sp. H2]|nr:Aryl hydrocarbon receptor [Trichoplax sp. H2]|eukprot:RDD38943.1 Aryl hydrocarbon receptor [Trichoplax sp. H2]
MFGRRKRRHVKHSILASTNPSKRHRDKLNCELDNLTKLLPCNNGKIAKLDKLSILRLSVSYLRAKTLLKRVNQIADISADSGGEGSTSSSSESSSCSSYQNSTNSSSKSSSGLPEGELLMEALNGFIILVTVDGEIFFVSSSVSKFLGLNQANSPMFQNQLLAACQHAQIHHNDHRTNRITNSRNLSRRILIYRNTTIFSCVCQMKCVLPSRNDYKAIHIHGKIKKLYTENKWTLFATCTAIMPDSLSIGLYPKNVIFQSKHTIDFTFLEVDDMLMKVLGFTRKELIGTSAYKLIHQGDVNYIAQKHVNGEARSGTFRLLTKSQHWIWVHGTARCVFKKSTLDSLMVTYRVVSDLEGEESLKKRPESSEYQINGCAMLCCEKSMSNNSRQYENGRSNILSGIRNFDNSDLTQHISNIVANTLIDNQNCDNTILFEQQYFLDDCNNDVFMGSSSFLTGNLLNKRYSIPSRQSSSNRLAGEHDGSQQANIKFS